MKIFPIFLFTCIAALLLSGCTTPLPPNRPTQAELYIAAESLFLQADRSGSLEAYSKAYYTKNKCYPLFMLAPSKYVLTALHGAKNIYFEPMIMRFQERSIQKGWFTFSAVLGQDRRREIRDVKELLHDPEYNIKCLVEDGKYLPAVGVMRFTVEDNGYKRKEISWTVTLEIVSAESGLTVFNGMHTIERSPKD